MVHGATDKLAAGLGEVVIEMRRPITEIANKTREINPNEVNSVTLRSEN